MRIDSAALCLVFCVILLFGSVDGYDFFTLSLQWGPTFCYHHHLNGGTCLVRPTETGFTIHGFWPSTIEEPQPRNCLVAWHEMNLNVLWFPQVLNNEMKKLWPSYTMRNDDFWEYQWAKHGRCSFPGFTQITYLLEAMNAFKSLHLFEALQIANIVPVDHRLLHRYYYRQDLIQAVGDRIGFHQIQPELFFFMLTPIVHLTIIDVTPLFFAWYDASIEMDGATETDPQVSYCLRVSKLVLEEQN
ncbi:hypothetical protein KIW84_066492 [Lathyrus oleraceus]|uniref:Uncharacterized protein n=1 Tax=Pisum sativum TaxID=3888 RepID=A0A9D4WJM8_PEA|nr:hypothetical protein KIW84_066476 [Pisum sativum]KAI5402025.1 hypothetical protein KIW84_066478 [Pisum sativum]KAI5402039.1 hypothetical protein KIW84_066492 [Pisum sativum]